MALLYAQIECDLPRDPKMIKVGPLARLVYIQFVLYSRENLLDGHVDESALQFLAPDIPNVRKYLAKLVEVGALLRTVSGWCVPEHVWIKRNPTRTQVNSKRDAKKSAGEEGNHTRWHVNKDIYDKSCRFCIANGSQVRNGCETGAIPIDKAIDRDKDIANCGATSEIKDPTAQLPEPDVEDRLNRRVEQIATRYAELRYDRADQTQIRAPKAWKANESRQALDMPKIVGYARDWNETVPVDVLASALNGDTHSLRYFEDQRTTK